MARATCCGVAIQTWGTKFGAGDGMLQYFDTKMFGGNVGHASLVLTIPDTVENKELIKKYCITLDENSEEKKLIPHQKKIIRHADGTKENIYEVRFSWWPSGNQVYLEDELNLDQLSEWLGVDFPWSKDAEDFFKPEKRIYSGSLGAVKKTLGIASISHYRKLDIKGRSLLKLESAKHVINRSIKSGEILVDKLEARIADTGSKRISESEVLLLGNFHPDLIAIYLSKNEFGNDNLENMLSITKKQLQHLKKELKTNQKRIEAAKNEFLEYMQDGQNRLIKLEAAKRFLEQKKDSGINMKNFADLSNIFYLDFMNKKWKKYVKDPSHAITPEEVISFIQYCDQETIDINDGMDKLRGLEYLDDFLTLGKPPDNNVYLPIKKQLESDIGFDNGMDVEAMLMEMNALVSDNTMFDLYSKNCSETVGKILEAGAPEAHLKAIAANRSWGAFGNPQMVYNAAMRIQTGIYDKENSNIWHMLSNFNPIERVQGILLKIYINDSEKASIVKKFFIGAALLVVAALGLSLTFIRGFFNPLKTMEKLLTLLTYAYSTNYTPLKVATTILLMPFILIYQIPAALQLIINVVFINPIKKIVSYISTKHLVEMYDEKRASADQEFSQYINRRVVVIKDSKPMDAIVNFIQALSSTDDCIPVFSKKSSAAVYLLARTRPALSDELYNLINSLPNIFDLKKNKILRLEDCVNVLNGIALQRVKQVTAMHHSEVASKQSKPEAPGVIRKESIIYNNIYSSENNSAKKFKPSTKNEHKTKPWQ